MTNTPPPDVRTAGSAQQPGADPLLDVRGLSIAYRSPSGPKEIVSGVSLALAAGGTLGLVGESGCGKSTLATALLGHQRAGAGITAGTVRVAGEDLATLTPARLRALRGGTVALVPQNAGHALTPTMRVGRQLFEVLTAHRGISGERARTEAAALFAQVRLPQPEVLLQRYPHELSGGQQQRVAIAMALAGNPRLLVLDEPTTGLDVVTQAGVLDLLSGIRRELGVAMVLVSHDLGVVSYLCDRVAVMYAGRVVELGSTRAAYTAPSHPYTRGLLGSVPKLAEPGLPVAMPGAPPSPGTTVPGCSFASRCPQVAERCRVGGAPVLRLLPGPPGAGSGSEGSAAGAGAGTGAYSGTGSGAGAGAESAVAQQWSACLRAEEVRELDPEVRPIHQRAARAAQAPVLVSLRDVAIDYRRGRARSVGAPTVAGIDLDIHRGETLALVGESGSGKSTLAWALAGLRTPSAGTLLFHGGEGDGEGDAESRGAGGAADDTEVGDADPRDPARSSDGPADNRQGLSPGSPQRLALPSDSPQDPAAQSGNPKSPAHPAANPQDLARPSARRPSALRRRLQLVFQNADTSLNPRRAVSEALRRPLRLFGLSDRAGLAGRVGALLDDVGLDRALADRLPGQLSGGQRQRVGIARALAAEPDLVLADEIVSALDVSVQASVLRLLDRLRTERGITYLFISHDLAVVRSLADRVAVLYLGRLCEVGDVEAVFSGTSHPYTRLLLDAVLEPGPQPDQPDQPGQRARRPVDEPESAPPAAGCPFRNRCPHRIPGTCDTVTPPWRDAGGGHRIRCHLELADLTQTGHAQHGRAQTARSQPTRTPDDGEPNPPAGAPAPEPWKELDL